MLKPSKLYFSLSRTDSSFNTGFFFFSAHVSVALGLNKLIWSTMVTSLIKSLTACGRGISPPEHLRCFKPFSLHVARCENNNCGWTNVCRNVKVTHTLNMMKWVSPSLFFYSSYFSISSLSLPASLLLPFLTSIMYSDTLIHCSLFSLCVSIVPRPSLFSTSVQSLRCHQETLR